MPTDSYVSCPFCKDTEFDLVGLRDHLANNRCEAYNSTPTILEERQAIDAAMKPPKDKRGNR